MIEKLKAILGPANVLQGDDAAKWSHDWTGQYQFTPLAVLRPATTAEVSAVMKLAHATQTPVVPVSGNTGLAGGTIAEGALMISLDRMNALREIRPDARIAIVEAGVILQTLQDAVEQQGMIFPLTFGAKGSAMAGGFLSTNAGGSNVLRYGNTRDLCLGLEVVLPDGNVLDIMSELHKDNSGYNLRHLMIGAEGTLGIITAAVLKLHPKPLAYGTAMVAAPSLSGALELLNRLQEATGGKVEAFEYMPRNYIAHHQRIKGGKAPFDADYDVNILVEIASASAADCTPDDSGQTPLARDLENVLEGLFNDGLVLDAVVAQSVAQRGEMWARREAAAEVILSHRPLVNNDIAVPLDRVADFLSIMEGKLQTVDPGAEDVSVAHLGDGNVHYAVWAASDNPVVHDQIMEEVEDVVLSLGGSFSAEHGIGTSKLPSMARRKNPVAIATMKAIKAALDPHNIMNPGKVLPE